MTLWGRAFSSASEDVPCMLWNLQVHHHFHNNLFGNELEFYRNVQNGKKLGVS
jgi:hypothetical protein